MKSGVSRTDRIICHFDQNEMERRNLLLYYVSMNLSRYLLVPVWIIYISFFSLNWFFMSLSQPIQLRLDSAGFKISSVMVSILLIWVMKLIVWRNHNLDRDKKIGWVLYLALFNIISIPIYLIVYRKN